MAKSVDYRLYVTLEMALTRKLVNAWRKESASLYERISMLCREKQWDKARLLVTDLDMTEAGQNNREWIKFLLLSTAVFGASIVARTKPSFVGVGSFENMLTQVTNNFVQYLELNATQQIQDEALQLIADDELAVKTPPAIVSKGEKPHCPHCGSTDYGLMPSDFETAKCHKCGKNWNHGIVPGINDPGDISHILKADPISGRYVTPFVSFDKQGEDKLHLIASLNSSRLATWGFTAEAEVRGIVRYRLTNVMDGRTSVFCAFINGHEFNVSDARAKVIEALNVQDPNDLKTVQPWPKQTKEAMEAFEEMSDEELKDRGLHIPPFHPRCRTLCKIIGAKDKEPTPEPPPDQEVPPYLITMQTLKELGLADATQEQVDHWNAYVGVNPIEILGDLSGKAPQEILSKELGTRPIKFMDNGDIGLNAKGIMGDVRYAVGTVLDPYSGTYYLSHAELMAGNVVSEQKFLRRLFTAMITTGEKTAAESLVVQVAGDVATYVKLGFLPDPGDWQAIRLQMLEKIESPDGAEVFATLSTDKQLLIKHLLNDNDEHALGALADLLAHVKGKTVGEWLMEGVTGEFSLDLTDQMAVGQAKAYLA